MGYRNKGTFVAFRWLLSHLVHFKFMVVESKKLYFFESKISNFSQCIEKSKNALRCLYVKQAKRITFYDKEALFNKMIFCEDCYRRLHYDKNGKTLYKDYLVFPLCNQ